MAVAPAPSAAKWMWPGLAPGTGQPMVSGPPASVSGPIPAASLYLWILAAWLVFGVIALLVVIRVVLLLVFLLGLAFGQHGDPPALL